MYIYIYVSTHSFFVVNTILVCIYVYMSYNCWESCISHASGLGSLVSQAKRIIQIQFFYIAGNFENIPDFRGPGLKTFSKTIPMRARIELDSHFLSRWTEYFLLVLAQFSAGQFPPSNLPPGQYSLRSIITHIYNLYISFYFMVIGKTKASQTGKLYRGKIFPRKMLPKVSYLPIIWSESRASYLFEVCHKKKKYIHIYR